LQCSIGLSNPSRTHRRIVGMDLSKCVATSLVVRRGGMLGGLLSVKRVTLHELDNCTPEQVGFSGVWVFLGQFLAIFAEFPFEFFADSGS
jgi:hypothetical protein